jgi:hypothetical protein
MFGILSHVSLYSVTAIPIQTRHAPTRRRHVADRSRQSSCGLHETGIRSRCVAGGASPAGPAGVAAFVRFQGRPPEMPYDG